MGTPLTWALVAAYLEYASPGPGYPSDTDGWRRLASGPFWV